MHRRRTSQSQQDDTDSTITDCVGIFRNQQVCVGISDNAPDLVGLDTVCFEFTPGTYFDTLTLARDGYPTGPDIQSRHAKLDPLRFTPQFLEELRARLPVSEVVGKRVKLKKAGREWKGLSPFQQEKTPSFTINDQKGFYHDFSSGKHGDIISFLMETEGVGFTEAVERLAAMAGVPLPAVTPDAARQEQRRKTLHDVMELAAKFFQDTLNARHGARARGYLADRSISPATQLQFRLGYAPGGPGERFALKEHLGAQGISTEGSTKQQFDAEVSRLQSMKESFVASTQTAFDFGGVAGGLESLKQAVTYAGQLEETQAKMKELGGISGIFGQAFAVPGEAGQNILAVGVHRRKPVLYHEGGDARPLARQKWIGNGQDRIRALTAEREECPVEVALLRRLDDLEIEMQRRCRNPRALDTFGRAPQDVN